VSYHVAEPPKGTAILRAEVVESAARPTEFSVVIPCLNEARTLERCLRKATESFRRLGIAGELIVADNGSSDGSQEVATRSGARVVRAEHRGYGHALAAGIAAAKGRFVIMGDGDDSYDFGDLSPFVERLLDGSDLVVGNRFQGGVKPGAMPILHKYIGNPILTLIGKWLFRIPVGDVYCGLRGFRRQAITDLDLRSPGMEYALEMIVKAKLHGLKISEVPTTLSPDGRGRPPHLRTWRDGWRSLRFFLLFSPRWLFFYPGLFLTVVGIGTIVWLLPASRRVGGVTLDVHTMLYGAVAVLVGFEAIVFATFARLVAVQDGLVPRDPRFDRQLARFSLERGLLLGLVLIVAGLVGSLYALGAWEQKSFGHLNYPHTMRIVIPSALGIALGFQMIVASFFFGILGLRDPGAVRFRDSPERESDRDRQPIENAQEWDQPVVRTQRPDR
jgi:glycosyltransferase involved in cell wall biosynthesis